MSGSMIYPHKVNMLITGKITLVYDRHTGASTPMVYQRVRKGLGNAGRVGNRDLQLRRYLPQLDPRRPLQLAGRRRMAAAIGTYQTLTNEERKPYRRQATGMAMSGYNLFIREFCEQHPIEDFLEDRVKLEFYATSGNIAKPFTTLKFYLMESI